MKHLEITHSEFNEESTTICDKEGNSIDTLDLMHTYEVVFKEKNTAEKAVIELTKELNIYRSQLAEVEEKFAVQSEDINYLRTENTKVKNELKQIKMNDTSNIKEVEYQQDIIITEDFVNEFNIFRRDYSDFKKYVWNQLATKNGSVSPSKEAEAVSNLPDLSLKKKINTSKSDTNIKQHVNIMSNTESTDIEEPVKIVPGVKPYSRIHTTFVISDSTIGNMTAGQLRKNIDQNNEDVIVNRHPGATTTELNHYCTLPLNQIRPENCIIFAGSNDISRGVRNKDLNENVIVNNILNIGRKAKAVGTKKIFISSMLVRYGYRYANIITRINTLLESCCMEEGFIFLDHSDVTLRHICGDGLHTNYYGHTILKMNILLCFYTFNPYLCNFSDIYDKAL